MLHLPAELRLNIFEHVFRGTALRYGFDRRSDLGSVNTRQINLIQAVCKNFCAETQDWVKYVTFDYYSTETFVDFFIRIPKGTRCQIRNVRVKAFLFPLYPSPDEWVYHSYDFSEVLPLFPGLRLDCLTVLDPFHDPGVNDGWGDRGACAAFEGLLKSNGWKELHFISGTPEMLTCSFGTWSNADGTIKDMGLSVLRPAQPALWRDLLLSRDGQDSGASVEMFLGKGPSGRPADRGRTTERMGDREAIHQPAPDVTETIDVDPMTGRSKQWTIADLSLQEAEDVDEVEYGDIRPDFDSQLREVRLIARRGRLIDCTETGSSINEKLSRIFETYGWKGIKEEKLLLAGDDGPCSHL